MTNDLDTTPQRRAPSRRAVLRTAAHAAWVVPAVQIATSVPAFASASNHATIDLTATATRSGKVGTVNLTVTNNGVKSVKNGNSTASTVTLTFSGNGFLKVASSNAGTVASPTVVLSNVMVGSPVTAKIMIDLDKMEVVAGTKGKVYVVNVTASGVNAIDGTPAGLGTSSASFQL